ncbi:Putative disease resistance RGA3 [Gossypium arboreum]|uniref:Putative disease resistance RGA3 n=1 Tax=Gossypium arboreum TaxID=29729 RepID=A0A0B0MEG3_GOSAR|nr:Putative disease resistance RGA3 [Gossypium arboreum]
MAEALLGAVLEVVVSKLISIAAEQTSVAWGFQKELKRLRDSLEMIEDFLQDAEEMQTKEKAVKTWLQSLKDVAYEANDVLDEFDYEILRRKVEIRNKIRRKVRNFLSSNNSILFRLKMANEIKDILKSLDNLNKLATDFGLQKRATDPDPEYGRREVETSSVLTGLNIIGRKNDVSKVVDLLVNPKDKQIVSVVPIVGMAGLGKTTLAQLVYNDLNVETHFDVKFWVCVSNHFDVKTILKEMLEHFTRDIPQNMNALIKILRKKIGQAKRGKEQIKYLLVLDDVWSVEKWDELKNHLMGISKNGGNGVIVTTRIQDVASKVQTLPNQRHQPGRLEDEECWSIIKERAWSIIKERALMASSMSHELELIGKEIAKQCRGVPLVANVIGGTMSNIEMNPRAWLEIQKSGVWGSPESVLKVESVLKLSFDRLSSPSLKKCFAYCAMFPKDYCFGKEELIQLWMAEGFLGSSMAMVDIGDKYLNELLSNSLFQDVQKNTCGNILTFKMHDSVHDLSLSVSKFDTLLFRENSSLTLNECSHIRHLNVGCDGEPLPEILTAVAPKVYSLFSEIDVSKKLSKSFTRLRVLKFVCATNICELPDSLGELKHLRYLGISWTSIKTLPKSTTKLYNLQTLRLLGLLRLTFPYGLENLISLKHLYFDRKELQPVNIGNLTCLQTLSIFFVGSERGRSIKELGSLKELRGELKICHLGGVRDKQEANGANLRLKEKLCKVIFDFEGSDSGSSGYNSEEVMEGLQPHTNLQSLTVSNYQGESFPSWMLRPVGDSNTGLFLLNNLMELNFFDCINCESLPPLGQLHNLQFLELRNLKKVKRMGNEFYCNEGIDGMNKVIKVFPALKKLTLEKMGSLEEWTAMAATKTFMFPCLEELDICDCPFLKSVPLTGQCSSLKKLRVSSCNKLEVLPVTGRCSSLEKLSISGCEKLSKIGDGLFTSSLQNLSIDSCNELEVLSLPGRCSSLEKFSIFGCEKLSKIGDGLSACACLNELDLEGFSSLQNLSIDSCNELEVLPITGRCSSLEKLRISSCKNMTKIGDGLSTSTYLKELDLYLCSNLSWIPDLEGFSSLQNLSIDSCKELASFPLKAPLSSLKKLRIHDCPNLKPIPSLDGLSSLTELEFNKVGEGWSCLLPNMLRSNTSLCSLTILNLPDLIRIPDDSLGRLNCLGKLAIGGFSEELQEFPCLSSFQYLSASLRVLELTGWEKLKSLPPQLQFLSALEELTILEFQGIEAFPEWLGNLSSLRHLYLSGFGKLKSLPHQLQLPTALEDLTMWGFHEIEALPDSFRNLSSLRCLRIWSCNKLMYLPSVDVMGSLSKLETIDIFMCPQLETRCERESGPEWSKISHIPHICINYRMEMLIGLESK